MTLRKEWRFSFTANELYLAADRLHQYHAAHQKRWARKHTEAIHAAKTAGVEVREVEMTGGKQAQVILDPTVQNDINVAQRKRDDHDAKAREYATWSDSFKLMPGDQKYDLEPDDVEFFDMTRSRVDLETA